MRANAQLNEQYERMSDPNEPWASSMNARPLRAAAGIWISYLVVLFVADYVAARASASSLLPVPYYLLQLFIALFVLTLTTSSTIARHAGRALVPMLIVGMGILPMIATAATVPVSSPGPLSGVGGGVMLRTLPMLTVVVVLIAWHYRIGAVIGFCVITSLLFVVLHIGSPLPPVRVATLAAVQGMGLLVLGFSVSLLMDRLRTQRASLEQANRQLRQYASTLEQLAASRERNRVARELHDTLAHTLSGMIVQLEATKAIAEVDARSVGSMIETTLETARAGMYETRRALKALRARPLEDLGLARALAQLADQFATTTLHVECVIAPDLPQLPPDVEQSLYRVAQEATANVAQHAGATTLNIWLGVQQGRVHLRVSDNGRGFQPATTAREGHFGLTGMEERALLIGGHLTISSTPGQGTTVLLTV